MMTITGVLWCIFGVLVLVAVVLFVGLFRRMPAPPPRRGPHRGDPGATWPRGSN